eukprot:gnl/MRDRNA2_/MRDRNA2_89229_c0_seq1.p1 gnl/MRDRNA2_/MRDRNA2_89229_c0~~gnl/MRDRNA2_/MRDRNA2_89229_c0_seq1.p1  ORF type:complete len:597 (-),score=132.90 gnl/MRDRNA2_/MRDRNA2_89229_c0_seq1:31-1776(-)
MGPPDEDFEGRGSLSMNKLRDGTESCASLRFGQQRRTETWTNGLSFEDQVEEYNDPATVAVQIQRFLDDWQYLMLESHFSLSVDRHTSITWALQFLQLHGILGLGPGEAEALVKLDEYTMIDRIVNMMPEDAKAHLASFLKQSELVLSSAASLRKALDSTPTDASQIVNSLAEMEPSGIPRELMRQATIFFAKEVSKTRAMHKAWHEATQVRIERLLRCTEECYEVNRALQALEGKMAGFRPTQSSKAQAALSGVLRGQDAALLENAFRAWSIILIRRQALRDLEKQCAAEVEEAELELVQFQQAQVNKVRSVLSRKNGEADLDVVALSIQVWAALVADAKARALAEANQKKLEEKLASFATSQAEKTKQLMLRMTSGADMELVNKCIQAWAQAVVESKKEQAALEEAKKVEAMHKEYMEGKNAGARGVMERMSAASDAGLMLSVLSSWNAVLQDAKRAREVEAELKGPVGKLRTLKVEARRRAYDVVSKIVQRDELDYLVWHFGTWVLIAKCERLQRSYDTKLQSRRAQIAGVQGLFKEFATKLEQGVSISRGSTPRDNQGPSMAKVPIKTRSSQSRTPV